MTTVPAEKPTKAAWAILAAMGFGALIAQMFSTVIGPALPTIKADLALSLSTQTWTITAYSLAFGAALVAGGRLGDLVGEVKMIVTGLVIFGGGLLMSAIAIGGPLMISGRAVQGIGIGISAPATLSIVVNSFPLARRGLAVGVWGFAHGFGLLFGPLFAAWMMDVASWRWIFWVALPLTAVVIAVSLLATRGYTSVLATGIVYIPFLVFIGSLYFINVLGYSPGKAANVILITTAICMVFEPPAGRWVDKVGPGLPITVALLMQAVALAWMGLSFTPTSTIGQMAIPLALMGIGVGLALPACNTAGMSAVDPERAGMGSGLMQMTFNIPAALGVGLITSIIGGLTTSEVRRSHDDRPELRETAARYADAVQDGDMTRADDAIAGLPQDSVDAIKQAVLFATSDAITVSMLVLAAVALAGAIFAWVVIGRRRTPDHIEMTRAAAV
ncbi:MAG: MFS transporter [Mycobacterium sp.]|nr:MFS transporter [Mycobacterium sp.]